MARNGLILVSVAACLLGGGCATNRLSTEEVDYRRQIDAENWHLCQKVYKENHVTTVHVDHIHQSDGSIRDPRRYYFVRSDLNNNSCQRVLGQHWIDY